MQHDYQIPPECLALSDDESSIDRKARWIAREAEEQLIAHSNTTQSARRTPPPPPPRESSNALVSQFEFALDPGLIMQRSKEQYSGDPTSLLKKIDEVMPNIRDLSVSACLENMAPNLLFRSARPFSQSDTDVHNILVETLKIQTIIDLRDDDLSSIEEEQKSRVIVSRYYRNHFVTQSRPHAVRFQAAPPKPTTPIVSRGPPTIATYRQVLAAAKKKTEDRWKGAQTAPAVTDEIPLEGEVRRIFETFARLKELRSDLSDSILLSLADDPHMQPYLHIMLSGGERARNLYVINLFDTPAVRKRIIDTVTNSRYLPFILAAKVTDKLMGKALAPYYFCKYIMSGHDIFESYKEMLLNCGEVFAIALKVIALAKGPVLFHCSLGKDRTGCLSMLILSILGASESAILFDYSYTGRYKNPAYRAYTERFITTYSGLSESFCTAKEETARQTLDYLKKHWGSVSVYLDDIGFDTSWKQLMRQRYLTKRTRV